MISPRRVLLAALALSLLGGPGPVAHASDPRQPDPQEDIDPHRPAEPAEVTAAASSDVRMMRYPVEGPSSYIDTFGACRGDGCSRSHMGADIFGEKLQPLIAANDGWITYLRRDASGTAGNGLAITDSDGWRYLYLHLNNDTPGTDPPRWRFAPGIELGSKVFAGQLIGYLGDSGNAETTPPHLHFELRRPDGVTINPDTSLTSASYAPPVPRLYLFEALRGGSADDHIGWATARSVVLACDLDGDGVDEPLQIRDRMFSWAPDSTDGAPVTTFPYGAPGDVPLCGDWDGDGTDTIGVRRGRTFMLRNANGAGPAHHVFGFGVEGDVPVVGDWDGDGIDTVGAVRSTMWYLNVRHASGAAHRSFRYGQPGDTALVGDWDGDGISGPGVRRGRTTMLRNALSGGASDVSIMVGSTDDVTVVGSWSAPVDPGLLAGNADSVSLWRARPR
jgi:murein DD-endopeptidase MepM/ murein hydrolase activator NlpD